MRKQKRDQAYWEKQLSARGLGIVQPLTDNSEGEMVQMEPLSDLDDFAKLRTKIDGSDSFMTGHQIKKVRGLDREIPEWALDKREIQKVLLRAFPRLETSPIQRRKAGRWAMVINLYYRMRLPRQVVAKELNMTETALKSVTRSITRVQAGLRADGSGKRAMLPLQQPLREPKEGRNDRVQGPLLHNSGDGSNGEDGTPQG